MKDHQVARHCTTDHYGVCSIGEQIMLIKKPISQLASLIIVMLTISTMSFASGPELIELHHTVEEARINIKLSDPQSGVLTARLLECPSCSPNNYSFDSETVLINQFGAQRPIEELDSWSGSRAMFHYLKSNNYVEQIQILP